MRHGEKGVMNRGRTRQVASLTHSPEKKFIFRNADCEPDNDKTQRLCNLDSARVDSVSPSWPLSQYAAAKFRYSSPRESRVHSPFHHGRHTVWKARHRWPRDTRSPTKASAKAKVVVERESASASEKVDPGNSGAPIFSCSHVPRSTPESTHTG